MAKKVISLKSQVSQSDLEDVHKNWIRVSEDLRDGIPNGAYAKVIANKKKIYCQSRGTPGKAGQIEINEWYRNALGWTDPPTGKVEMTIKEVGLLGRIKAWSSHPEDIVRIGIGLGMISVGLGALSVVLSVLPPSIRLMASNSTSDSIWGIAGLVVGLAFIPIVVFLLITGSWTFLRKLPKQQ